MRKCGLLFSPAWVLVCSLMQNFTRVLNLIKEAFFKHGDENILKTCINVMSFAANESQGDLQDSANQVIKETVDDLLVKLRSSITQAGVSLLTDLYMFLVSFALIYVLLSNLNKRILFLIASRPFLKIRL